VTPATYRGLTLCGGDQDWFALQLGRGDLLGVNLDADPFSESTFSTVIKDANGRTVSSGRLLVSYVAPSPAKYFVVVTSTDPFQTYDITFLVSRGTPCDDDSNEPNDEPSSALTLNAQTQIDGRICPQDNDYFRIAPMSSSSIRVSLTNYDAGRGLLSLCLVSADGKTTFACSDEAQPSVTATAQQLNGLPALARVRGSTDRVSNAYTLQVEFP
jgi:hypothetical protein